MKRKMLFAEVDLTLDVVILIIAGLMMIITGILLFPASEGVIPYYENGAYGLVLFLFSLQVILLGRTPFGDMKRSGSLLYAGLLVASAGIVTCFIPGVFHGLPEILLFLCFTPGGAALLAHMFFSRDRFLSWFRHGGLFHLLWAGCAFVYILSMFMGVLILNKGFFTGYETAASVLAFGAALLFLALVMRRIYTLYPPDGSNEKRYGVLSSEHSVILLTGIFMILLGLLLVPVSLGFLPFAGSAQLGLLMVIMAFRMLSAGDTPIGSFRRTWLVFLCGILFAALGIVSCIIPDILVPLLTMLIGLLNIAGGAVGLCKTGAAIPRGGGAPVLPVLRKLTIAQVVLNLLSILFGASMLFPGLLPALATGLVLAANGGVLLYLLRLLIIIRDLSRGGSAGSLSS